MSHTVLLVPSSSVSTIASSLLCTEKCHCHKLSIQVPKNHLKINFCSAKTIMYIHCSCKKMHARKLVNSKKVLQHIVISVGLNLKIPNFELHGLSKNQTLNPSNLGSSFKTKPRTFQNTEPNREPYKQKTGDFLKFIYQN